MARTEQMTGSQALSALQRREGWSGRILGRLHRARGRTGMDEAARDRRAGAAEAGVAGAVAHGRIQLRTLALIRWVAIAGQAAALLVVHYGLGFSLLIGPALATVGASILVNLVIAMRRPSSESLGDKAVARYLGFDVVQLAALLYLTGGLENPFAFLLLAPVAVSATVLSMRSTVTLCVLSLICISVLAVWHLPLPWPGEVPHLPAVYILGIWVALAIGILFFAAYTWRVAEEARRLSDGLTATQLALAREQQLSALGSLAAAAAHELGSPLGTIAIAAREIASELPKDCPFADDVQLLISEAERCRDILAGLAHNPRDDDGPFSRLPIGAIVEQASDRHQREGITVTLDVAPFSEAPRSPAPRTAPRAEVIHGLGNLIQNAVQFARTGVEVTTRWNDHDVTVTIADDGPGFPQVVLERLGEPYLSVRRGQGGHMGLGIFIAQTLLQHSGARLDFRNAKDGGAVVAVNWDRAVLEAPTEAAAE